VKPFAYKSSIAYYKCGLLFSGRRMPGMFRKTLRQFLFGSALVVSSLFADMTAEQRVEDFEAFWNSYKEAYVFFELKNKDYGVDWDQIKGGFIEKLKNSTSDTELYAAVTEAQALLQDGHCYNGSFAKIRETEKIYFQRIGVTMTAGHKIVVSKVVPGSVFAQAGVQTGYEVVKWDGKTVRQLAKDAKKRISASSEGQFWAQFSSQFYIHSPLLGRPKSPKAEIVFRDFDGNLINVTSKWESAPPTGKQEMTNAWVDDEKGVSLDEASKKRISGPLPMEVRIFKDANLAYVKIESWMKTEDPIEQFEKTFEAIKDTEGMILDLRNNGGGVGPWGILFTNYLLEKNVDNRVAKKGWLSKIVGWFTGSKDDSSETEETFESDFDKTPNDSWMERNLSKVFFRTAFPQLDEATLNEIFTQPATMKYVLKKAFGMEIADDELMKYYKDGEFEPFYVNLTLNERFNKIKPYTKPIVALTNGGCYSTTDICLTILKEFKRISIVGTPNGAGSGSPIPFVLPNSGLQVYVPHARAFPPYGTMIEGRPLEVDVRASQTVEDLIKGKDTVLTEGVRLLLQNTGAFSSLVQEEVDPGEGEAVFSTLQDKDIDWGNIPTPDWAIQSTIEQIRRDNFKVSK
jgi:C-terminal processing protease CtpA/Prc